MRYQGLSILPRFFGDDCRYLHRCRLCQRDEHRKRPQPNKDIAVDDSRWSATRFLVSALQTVDGLQLLTLQSLARRLWATSALLLQKARCRHSTLKKLPR